MIPLIGLFAIIILSMVVVRVGGIALELTGLSPEVAAFQAQSAFSGAGFTTSESESIVSHPVRRRIIRVLILFGSVGITSSIATFVLTFVGQDNKDISIRGGILFAGLIVIFLLSRSRLVHRLIKKVIVGALKKSKKLQIYDYQEVLGISSGYTISRMVVKKSSWMSSKKLKDLKLHLEGILILSVHRMVKRQEKFIGIPSGETVIEPGDIITAYGRDDCCKGLSQRKKGAEGDQEHKEQMDIEETRAELREKMGEV